MLLAGLNRVQNVDKVAIPIEALKGPTDPSYAYTHRSRQSTPASISVKLSLGIYIVSLLVYSVIYYLRRDESKL